MSRVSRLELVQGVLGVLGVQARASWLVHTQEVRLYFSVIGWLATCWRQLVSPASLLDSQHGCITSPHAKKESGWQFGLALSANVVALSTKMNKNHTPQQSNPLPCPRNSWTSGDQTANGV